MKQNRKLAYVHSRVEPAVYAKIKAIAVREDRTVSKVVERILREYTEKAA